jgi:hypothetical protein
MSDGSGVAIISDPSDPIASSRPAQWAIGQLQAALTARAVPVHICERIEQARPGDRCILAAGTTSPLATEMLTRLALSAPNMPEALELAQGSVGERSALLAAGHDARGLMYALMELADRFALSRPKSGPTVHGPLSALELPQPIVERPATPIRSAARLFVSELEDKPWFYDRAFWTGYLSTLAAERFNRFALTFGIGYDFLKEVSDAYLHFAYPFLVAVPGFDVRAVGLPETERERNLETLRFVSETASERGLHFQLGLWTHGYDYSANPGVTYPIEGLNADNHAAYCRDALRALLEACPAIQGVTFRIHGESGVPEAHYDFWRTVFDGIVQCGRKIEIDMHAKGIDAAMIEVALATGMPVNVSPKYWAEHMGLPYHQASIRPLELPRPERQDEGFFAKSSGSRSFLRYGYGDLLREDRRYGVLYRLWPGTQRLLLWGDPAMAASYARASTFCGSLGMELCEPLSFKGRKGSGLPGGRDAYADAHLKPAADWEKYRYSYRLWGRLLYNPDSPPATWRRLLESEFGAGAVATESALAHASRILPLITTAHLPSAANNSFWPEIYTNMPLVDEKRPHPYGDTPSPKRFGTVSPLDPELFSRIDDYAEELLAGRSGCKYSPLDVALWLEKLAESAESHLAHAQAESGDPHDPSFRRLAVDVKIQSGLGRFFAEKLRAGVLYALYARSSDETALRQAIKSYQAARAAWVKLSADTEGIYVRDITFGRVPHLRGHWSDRLAAIDQDIADLENRAGSAPSSVVGSGHGTQAERAIRNALSTPQRPQHPCRHMSPAAFRRGEPVVIEVSPDKTGHETRLTDIRLHYRRVNQSEPYRVDEMKSDGSNYRAIIPAS